MRRHVLPLALGLCAALVVPAHAGRASSFTATDPAGDANGVNSQTSSTSVPGTSSPASLAAADLRRVTVAAGPRRTVDVTIELGAAPDPAVGLDLRYDTDGCSYFGDLMLENYLDSGRGSSVSGCLNGRMIPAPTITGSTVRWSIPVALFHLREHAVLRNLRVYSQAGVGAAHAYAFPFVWDELLTRGTFVLP